MADILELTPQLLIEQSQELAQLKESYDGLFQAVISDLNGVNSCWSELLANNFSGKIQSAQQSFNGILAMLQNGVSAVGLATSQLGTSDKSLANMINGNLADFFKESNPLSGISAAEYFEKNKSGMSSSEQAWADLLFGKLKKKAGGKTAGTAATVSGVIDKVKKGDYEGAIDMIRKKGVGEFISAYDKVMNTKPAGLLGSLDYRKDYYNNLLKRTTQVFGERLNDEPLDFKSAIECGWNLTVQPVLDTTGDKIHGYVNLIPGASEHYAARGAKNGGDMANIALGDFYTMLSPDPDAYEYYSTYYKNAGGAASGIGKFVDDAQSFVKDSGGIGKAASNFGKTAVKDIGDSAKYLKESADHYIKASNKYMDNIYDYVDESGSLGNALGNFGKTAFKDAGSAISKLWHSVSGK